MVPLTRQSVVHIDGTENSDVAVSSPAFIEKYLNIWLGETEPLDDNLSNVSA